jgi:hypothetical protein
MLVSLLLRWQSSCLQRLMPADQPRRGHAPGPAETMAFTLKADPARLRLSRARWCLEWWAAGLDHAASLIPVRVTAYQAKRIRYSRLRPRPTGPWGG